METVPPNCRDPKDLPVLATAIDGKAEIIVSGDNDLRADDDLRIAMATYDIRLLGVDSFLKYRMKVVSKDAPSTVRLILTLKEQQSLLLLTLRSLLLWGLLRLKK